MGGSNRVVVKWHKTAYPGVRYREHPTRKHGMQPDKYFCLHYKLKGKVHDEALGWASEKWNAQKASIELARLKRAQIIGEGPETLREKRELAEEKRKTEKEQKREEELQNITFGEYFNNDYYPIAKTSKKATSYEKEMTLFRHWINPIIGEKPFRQIAQTDMERIKKSLLDKERAPKTIEYVLAVVRQVWNMARRDGLTTGDSPTKSVGKLKKDNRRLRFLTWDEADRLLAHLNKKSVQLHNMALLSLHTGMRAGEIFSLTWRDIDLARGIVMILDPKASKNRAAFMTGDVKQMFKGLPQGEPNDFVFKDRRHGGKIKEISHAFRVAIKDLQMNEGVTDRRQKVVFHSLRHSYASWLVENGTDLYKVKELMGHATIVMTERYSHLGQNALQGAVKRLDASLMAKKEEARAKQDKEQGQKTA